MVASKSAKVVKLSYPERVLGAFSQIQREHKRHAVHSLTLRAQVKKTAQARKDQLGPHWSSFVSKAVQKLEKEGILAASSSAAGSLILTDHGKQVIASARRVLSIPPHAALSSEEEESVWRQVIQQTIGRGIKRPRRSSFLSRDDDDDYEGEGQLSLVIPSRPKRVRLSLRDASPANESTVSMSHDELESRPNTSRRTHEGTGARPGSPLTDLEDENDETVLNRDQTETGTTRIRRGRGRTGTQALNEARETSPARFPTPVTTFGYNTSSPTAPGSALPTRSRPAQGVTGPQSGSFISNLSQQPTPTPSTHRTGPDDEDPPDFEDEAQSEYNHSNPPSTPDHSLAASRDDLPLIEEPSIAEKVADLERQLGSRKWDLERLQAKYAHLQDNYLTLEDNLIDRDTHISTLQDNVVVLEKRTAENTSTIERQTFSLSELQAAKDKMETSFLARVKELEQTIQTKDADVFVLKTEKQKYLHELSDAREALSRTELRFAAQASQVATAENQAAALRSTLEAAAAELESQKTSQIRIFAEKEILQAEFAAQKHLVDGLEEEKTVHLERISHLEGTLDALKATNNTVSEALSSATTEGLSVSEKLKALESNNESLLAQLSVAQGEKSALEVALETSEASVVSLAFQTEGLQDALSQENARVAEHSASLSHAQADIITLREKIITTEQSVSKLETDLTISNANVDDLRTQLTVATDAREALVSQLEEARKATADSAASLTEVKSTLATATNSLRDAQEVTTELQLTLDNTAAKFREEQDKNQQLAKSLATNESELRETEKNLAMVESMAGNFRQESEANGSIAKDLRTQLLEAHEKITTTTDLLSTAEAGRAQESEKHQAAISAFEVLLQSTRVEVDDLKSQLQVARTAHEALESSFNDQLACLTLARDQLESERTRVSDLESEVDTAVGKAQEVEEELAEVRVSKEADEKTIQNLKEMFTSLREAQMRSLAELDNQVGTLLLRLGHADQLTEIPDRSFLLNRHPYPNGDQQELPQAD
ncbi:hypothetical protein BDZ94DRAFT_1313465 [Collybia nuda]|uniref:Myosin heavy chain n=1 Tax=Collybia nuda TaxID=64659 RepID=A0A9P5XW95_9AGAR|nr:hypothetical protein BDZ94DRAFT_1313465 [Collybia nuda]